MKAKSSFSSFANIVKSRRVLYIKFVMIGKKKKEKNALKYEDRKKQEEQLANNVNGIIYVVKIRE